MAGVAKLGTVPKLEDEGLHATDTRGSKADGRRLPRTGRLYQLNIRANEKISKEFDKDAERLGLTRGAFFEKCYHAFKAGEGKRGEAFLLQAMVTLDHIARVESRARGELVTPEKLLSNLLLDRMERLGIQPAKSGAARSGKS
jgi:hypothetical protein